MTTILTAAGKGAKLTPTEADALFYREVNPQAGNYTVDTGDNLATIEYTGSGGHSITLPDASTLLAAEDTGAFETRIKNGGTGTLTVAFNTGDTADGVDADITLQINDCITLKCGSVTDDWMIVSLYSEYNGVITGTFTTASTSAGAQAAENVAHGLGSDDIDFGASCHGSRAFDSGGLTIWGIWTLPDKSTDMFGTIGDGTAPSTSALPSTGEVRVTVRNNHSIAQTIVVNWWARKRA